MKNPNQAFGKLVAGLRQSVGLSQEELADRHRALVHDAAEDVERLAREVDVAGRAAGAGVLAFCCDSHRRCVLISPIS